MTKKTDQNKKSSRSMQADSSTRNTVGSGISVTLLLRETASRVIGPLPTKSIGLSDVEAVYLSSTLNGQKVWIKKNEPSYVEVVLKYLQAKNVVLAAGLKNTKTKNTP